MRYSRFAAVGICAVCLALPLMAGADEAQDDRIKSLERKLSGAEAERDLALMKLKKLRQEIADIGPRYDEARYKSLVDRISGETSRLRGLPLKNPVNSTVLDKEGLHKLLERLLGEEMTPAAVAGMSFQFEKTGLMQPGQDLKAMYSGLLEGQVGGLYNDKDKSLYVVSVFDPSSLLGRVILSHEICHALQDQNFEISKLPLRTKNEDQNLAASAVLEGDATLLMMEWGGEHFKASDLLELRKALTQGTQGLDTAPPALVQTLVFPYLEGARFLTHLKLNATGEWRDQPFLHPPASTEQIMHPEKYWPTPEAPVVVTLPEWKEMDGLTEIYRGTQGEWGTAMILTPVNAFPKIDALSMNVEAKEHVAATGAAGWGGDQMVGVKSEDGKQWGLVWKTTWDTLEDATEFDGALRRRVAGWPQFSGVAEKLLQAGTGPMWKGMDRCLAIHVSGKDVVVYLGNSAERLDGLEKWMGR